MMRHVDRKRVELETFDILVAELGSEIIMLRPCSGNPEKFETE